MQGFNKYYPPDYDPEQSSSLNAYHGKHALGDRARKLDKGILIVRFELPFNIWCGGCDNHIGLGVRYNAEKSKVGNYYTTPIFNFRCKCHLCDNWFEIRTDPQNTRFVVHSGARQKVETWDPAENGTIVFDAHNNNSDEPPDPFASLEKTVVQKEKALTAAAQLEALHDISQSQWKDPYAASSVLRKSFRGEKRKRIESEKRAGNVLDRYGLGDRVSKEDLRTPAPDRKRDEDAEWAQAEREKKMRLAIAEGKRKRDERSLIGRPAKKVRRNSEPITSSSSSTSPAAKALAGRLGVQTALKSNPFSRGSSSLRNSLGGDIKFLAK